MIRLEQQITFNNYDKLFDFLAQMDSEIKDGKLFESCLQFEGRSWSLVIYPPDRVAALYQFATTIDPELQEAHDQQLSLLEICAGDYKNPQYIAVTPHLDMDGLKRIWCHDYCRVHGLALSEADGEDEIFDLLGETKSVIPYAHAVQSEIRGSAL